MRIVVPHAGAPHPDTVAALAPWRGAIEYCDVSGSDTAYARLVCELWRDCDDVLLVEHDIVPTVAQLLEMVTCPAPYCAAAYAWGEAVGPALGFTRFRSLFLRRYPHAAEIAARIPSVYGPAGHWRQYDVFLMGAVLRDLYGWQPCCHLPAVEHRNFADSPDAPLRTRVEGRMWIEAGLVERIAGEVAAAGIEPATSSL